MLWTRFTFKEMIVLSLVTTLFPSTLKVRVIPKVPNWSQCFTYDLRPSLPRILNNVNSNDKRLVHLGAIYHVLCTFQYVIRVGSEHRLCFKHLLYKSSDSLGTIQIIRVKFWSLLDPPPPVFFEWPLMAQRLRAYFQGSTATWLELKIRLEVNKGNALARSSLNFQSSSELFCLNFKPSKISYQYRYFFKHSDKQTTCTKIQLTLFLPYKHF